jgi:hypothetical protein
MIELRTLLIALLMPTLLWAQPSQPSNTDQPEPKATESTQPKPEPDQRGTAQMPIAVEIVPTQADKEKERREWLREHSKEHEESQLVWATWALVVITGLLAVFTGLLFWFTRNLAKNAKEESDRALAASNKALAASTAATQTLIKVERPYVTAGGQSPTTGGFREFFLEVHNMGKTPAFTTYYDVRFAFFKDVEGTDIPALPVEKRFPFDDRLAANQFKGDIDVRRIDPIGADVVYGAVWYLDWDKQEHCFRFILRVDPRKDTRPDISTLVHADYSKWD